MRTLLVPFSNNKKSTCQNVRKHLKLFHSLSSSLFLLLVVVVVVSFRVVVVVVTVLIVADLLFVVVTLWHFFH